jgi:hypothetical protein
VTITVYVPASAAGMFTSASRTPEVTSSLSCCCPLGLRTIRYGSNCVEERWMRTLEPAWNVSVWLSVHSPLRRRWSPFASAPRIVCAPATFVGVGVGVGVGPGVGVGVTPPAALTISWYGPVSPG